MRRALLHAGLAAALVLLLAACGGNDETTTPTAADEEPTTTSAGTGDDTTTSLPDDYPCNLLPHEEVETIAGNALESGDTITNNIDESGTKWTAQECTWAASELGGTEPTLAVSTPADFPSGAIDCPEPPNGTPVSGLGDQAYWQWTEAVEQGVGELRVCTADVMLGARVSGAGGESVIRPKVEALAQAALGAV
ncbi:MAG: hypothetical protein IT198_15335 [Acidimicrobiia bacterium]|nr:hypothetical protein [Acidimicrobiia bacterium]